MVADVTIGLAVYNGAKTIAAALDSLLAQTYRNFRITISDNASTDGTRELCQSIGRRDDRVHYERLDATISQAENYRRVLMKAETPFFMWAAADDLWAPGFLAAHHQFLTSHPDFVLSQSRVLFRANGVPTRIAKGTYALQDTPKANVARFFAAPYDNSRFYGLFRTEQLKKAYPNTIFHAFDWLVSGVSLNFGKHNEDSRILMVRDETAVTAYVDAVARNSPTRLGRHVPMLPLTLHILKRRAVPMSPALIWSLVRLNVWMTLRFQTLRLYSASEKVRNAAVDRPRAIRQLAALASGVLAPGFSERLQTAVGNSRAPAVCPDRRRQSRSAADVAPTFLPRKTFGWRPPSATHNGVPGVSIITMAENDIEDILSIIDQLPDAAGDLTYETVVIANHSIDATELILRDRSDVTYFGNDTKPRDCGRARHLDSYILAQRIVFLNRRAILQKNSIVRLVDALDQAEIAIALADAAGNETVRPEDGRDGCRVAIAFAVSRETIRANGFRIDDRRTFSEAMKELGDRVAQAGGRTSLIPGGAIAASR